jgi:hypothetical protein
MKKIARIGSMQAVRVGAGRTGSSHKAWPESLQEKRSLFWLVFPMYVCPEPVLVREMILFCPR